MDPNKPWSSLGMKAYAKKFYFDFNMTCVGTGMICPHVVTVSLLLGGILSWGIMWPLISKKAGDGYPEDATDPNMRGLSGYKVFVAISLILGGLYNFVRMICLTVWSLYQNWNSRLIEYKQEAENLSPDEQRKNALFMKDEIPFKVAAACYVALAVVFATVIPRIFRQMHWYYVAVNYCVAPVLCFCNAYGCGLTDWTFSSTYGKLGLFVFAALAGGDSCVIVGLVSCGVIMIAVECSAGMMEGFKTGYLTLSSPRSILAGHILGAAMGCIIAPSTFWLFWKAFPIGDPNGEYPAPYALIYREMATVGVEGFGALPKHCLDLCYGFFCMAIFVNFLREKPLAKWANYIPIPTAMAIPFYYGPYFAIDMFVGSTVIDMYSNCGSVVDAQAMFNRLPRRNVVSWSAMISAYVEQGQGEKALWLYTQMQKQCVTMDHVTLMCIMQACSATGSLEICKQLHIGIVFAGYDQMPSVAATLIHVYGSCASMVDAQALFGKLLEPDIVSWNACIAGYAGVGNYVASLHMSGTKPNEVTFVSVLSACSHNGLVVKGLEYFESISQDYGLTRDSKHYSSMLDLLGHAGDFRRIEDMLQRMPMEANLTIWLCLLGACHTYGNLELAKRAFDSAVNLQPKQATAYVLMSNIYADAGLHECAAEVENSRLKQGVWREAG